MKKDFILNYSAFSGWIANLGVVPLLLFAAFLFLPIFAFLFALLFLVTRVFETIFQLLSTITMHGCNTFQINKFHNLRLSPSLVKIGFLTSLLFFNIILDPPYATEQNQVLSHTISIGELVKIHVPNLTKFTIGNKETARVKALAQEKSLLIKGQGLGHTDLLLWFKEKKEPIKHQIFVVQKRRYLKLKSIKNRIENLGLKVELTGGTLQIGGTLRSKSSYGKLVEIYRIHKNSINLQDTALTNSLKLEIYESFLVVLQEYDLLDLDCRMKRLFIYCKGTSSIRKTLKNLKEAFLISWSPLGILSIGKQYQITLTLQQFENSKGHAFNLGLSQIEGNLGELLLRNPLSIIHKNTLALKESQFESQTLAQPKLKGRLNRPIKVRLGQEIPFLQSVSQGVATQDWRFAGLGIDLNLLPHTERLILKFKTNLSRPGERGINQNSQESEVFVELNKTQVLFDIGFRLHQKSLEKFPFLSQIPLFGTLFKGVTKGETYKKILCLVHVEEI